MTSIAEFFSDFYATAGPGTGIVELRYISHEQAHTAQQFFSDIPAELERQATAWDMRAKKSGVYFAVALRKPDAVSGKKEDVSVVTALWADIDVAKNGWDMQRTLGALKASPLRPSLVINSGNGYHCYWLLAKPLYVTEPEDIEYVEKLLRILAFTFSGDKAATDITRVLRVPLTHNRKGDKQLDVEFEVEDWAVEYERSQIEDLDFDHATKVLADGEWLSKETIKEKMKAARTAKGISGLAGKLSKEAGLRQESWTYSEIWAHAKYGGDARGAFIGLDEAILRATALLYARDCFGDDVIVQNVLDNVKRIKERDAPNERWNWGQERREIQDKLDRFKDRWQAMREQEALNGKKAKRKSRTK